MQIRLQSGISDNGAGALALITIHSGDHPFSHAALQQEPYVRFHAWQSIFLTVAWIALFIVLAIVGRLPIIGWFVWPLMMLIDLGMFILWLFVVLISPERRQYSAFQSIGPPWQKAGQQVTYCWN